MLHGAKERLSYAVDALSVPLSAVMSAGLAIEQNEARKRWNPDMTLRPYALTVMLACQATAFAQTDPMDFSLGELVAQEVISVARKRQDIGDVAAAVYVVSSEDIARMGVTTLPDALRLVPGVQVAAIGNNRWAVGVRGFNGRFTNSLLVMVDGRTVYSPLFSGTFWEALDIPLAEVDRIEVVRGPGASVWGANAVNGVVNIITKWARATQGDAAQVIVGSEDKALVYARHGGALDDGHYRLSYQGRTRDDSRQVNGDRGEDGWQTHRLGLRLEKFLGDPGELSVMGEVFRNDSRDQWNVPDITSPTLVRATRFVQRDEGVNLTARLNRSLDHGREWALQGSYQYVDSQVGDFLSERRHTMDLDGQYRFSAGSHDLIVGAGLRHHDQEVVGNGFFQVPQPHRRFGLASAFIHDEITLLPEELTLTAGLKFEHHTWTGNEWQPNLRLAWKVAPDHMLWAAVSEASRTPARIEYDMQYTPLVLAAVPPTVISFRSGERLNAERVRSYELGYRGQPTETTHIDVTGFVMRYRNLRNVYTTGFYGSGGWVVADTPLSLNGHGTVSGLEAAVDWQPSARWLLRVSYSHLEPSIELPGNRLSDAAAEFYMQRVPSDQLSAHLTWKPRAGHAMDMVVRHVGALINRDRGEPETEAYTELDLQYGWRVSPKLTLAVTGRNLLNARHAEFGRLYMPSPTHEIERSVHFTAQWALD